MPTNNELTYLKNFDIHKERLKECAKIIGNHGMKFGLEFVVTFLRNQDFV